MHSPRTASMKRTLQTPEAPKAPEAPEAPGTTENENENENETENENENENEAGPQGPARCRSAAHHSQHCSDAS